MSTKKTVFISLAVISLILALYSQTEPMNPPFSLHPPGETKAKDSLYTLCAGPGSYTAENYSTGFPYAQTRSGGGDTGCSFKVNSEDARDLNARFQIVAMVTTVVLLVLSQVKLTQKITIKKH